MAQCTDCKIVKADVSIAKNYLSKNEIKELNEIVTMYLDYATRQARRHIPIAMADWASKLDAFLQFNDAEILQRVLFCLQFGWSSLGIFA